MSRTRTPEQGTEEAVRALVQELFGDEALSMSHMTYGHGSVTYAVELGGSHIIVRTNSDANTFRGTLNNINSLTALGLPVPKVLAVDLEPDTYPFAYVITDRFAGTDLGFKLASMSHEQQTSLAEQIVRFERLVMTLPLGAGFGFTPIDTVGPYSSWFDAVVAEQAKHARPSADAEVEALRLAVINRLHDAEDRLAAIKPICFLDDLTTKNVIIDNGVLQGIVDFDAVCYGDPMFWLSLTNVAITCDVGPAGMFYVNELKRLWELTDEDTLNFDLYSAIHAVAFLSWGPREPEVRQRLTELALTRPSSHL